MHRFVLVLFISCLAGCSLWMPKPDPAQAWIELTPHEETDLQAVAVDGLRLDDDRYFQVQPGSRTLEVRYRFQVDSHNVGLNSEPLSRDCRLTLAYDRFTAGARYRLVAGGQGFRPRVKLYDHHRNLLAQGREEGCGDLADI